MTINSTTINRIKRVASEIAANTEATSPGPWFTSHGHVISPGAGKGASNHAFDVASRPSGKDHAVYGLAHWDTTSRNNDMRHIVTCEPVRMKKLTDDITELLAERDDITALAVRLDDLINNTMGGDDGMQAKLLGEAVTNYLSSLP